jgi:predicted TIM-barrel fold metal-dependent hydrolase
MSAWSEAGICSARLDVRFAPLADTRLFQFNRVNCNSQDTSALSQPAHVQLLTWIGRIEENRDARWTHLSQLSAPSICDAGRPLSIREGREYCRGLVFSGIADNGVTMRTITLEEHFVTPAFLDGPGREFRQNMLKSGGARASKIFEQLCDIGTKRLAEMDAAGIDMQVLSLNYPGTEQSEAAEAIATASETNDILADAVKKNPTRFAGLAALPTAVPDKAVEELDRRIRESGFKGAIINGHNRGRYLDDKFYWPILEGAEALNVPIYLHPTLPPKAVIAASYGGFSPESNFLLSGPGWGWHIETATHVIRMMLGGVFDRYPKLQIVVGHMGEGLPFMLPRLEALGHATKLQRSLGDYLRQNIHYTFAAFNFPATFLNLLLEVGAHRIMFSADYPYGSMADAVAFLKQLPVSPTDRTRIAHGNAERLFGL